MRIMGACQDEQCLNICESFMAGELALCELSVKCALLIDLFSNINPQPPPEAPRYSPPVLVRPHQAYQQSSTYLLC